MPRIAYIAGIALIAVGIALIAIGRKSRKDQIPFGPFLALGAVTVVFFGEELLIWYLGMHGF